MRLLLLPILGGCSSLVCGSGTVDADGTCVPESVVVCGEGTELVAGECTVPEVEPPDADQDGVIDSEDCAPDDASVYPGATETPYNGVDDDCDATTLDDDLDQDGYVDAVDCNDDDSTVHPGVTETPYNGVDDDCDALTLDDDLDQDGVTGDADCDDTDAAVFPGASETPLNGVDDDCDALTLDDDLDADGHGLATDCDDGNPDVYPGQTETTYNGVDDDCDALTLDDDLDQDGYPTIADCDEADPDVNPGESETAYNGVDDDCSAFTLDDDLDQDGHLGADDCDDADANVNSDATELPYNGIDDDCDDQTPDDDLDQDGSLGADDCDDQDPARAPGLTDALCDGVDEDCSGGEVGASLGGVDVTSEVQGTTSAVKTYTLDTPGQRLMLCEGTWYTRFIMHVDDVHVEAPWGPDTTITDLRGGQGHQLYGDGLTLDGFTITGGDAALFAGEGNTSAPLVELQLTNMRLQDNDRGLEGGWRCDLTIEDSEFLDNGRATSQCGDGNLIIRRSHFEGNRQLSSTSKRATAIQAFGRGNLILEDVSFVAEAGVGAIIYREPPNISSAFDVWSGLHIADADVSQVLRLEAYDDYALQITDSVIENNVASDRMMLIGNRNGDALQYSMTDVEFLDNSARYALAIVWPMAGASWLTGTYRDVSFLRNEVTEADGAVLELRDPFSSSEFNYTFLSNVDFGVDADANTADCELAWPSVCLQDLGNGVYRELRN